MRAALLAAAVLAPLLAAAAWGLWRSFDGLGMGMSLHGWIALGLGATLSIALGGGLMALAFISHRRGFDERAHWDDGSESE
ncbi:MAG: hypothetical protein GC189_07315 [Alphaproteobacteria bacterium]|nr:hypothetical protein [Alphaproteobacteria bacterium]